jgi:hypothetical protein
MDAHRVVGGDRAVDEAESRPAAVLLTELLERSLALPRLEEPDLDGIVIGLIRQR